MISKLLASSFQVALSLIHTTPHSFPFRWIYLFLVSSDRIWHASEWYWSSFAKAARQ